MHPSQVPLPDTRPSVLSVAGSGATSKVPAGVVKTTGSLMKALTLSAGALPANDPPQTSSAWSTRAPGGSRSCACERFSRQSLVVPNGNGGAGPGGGAMSCWPKSVVMKVPIAPRVPWPLRLLAPSRPSALPVKVMAPFVRPANRDVYCPNAGTAQSSRHRIASSADRRDRRRNTRRVTRRAVARTGHGRSASPARSRRATRNRAVDIASGVPPHYASVRTCWA